MIQYKWDSMKILITDYYCASNRGDAAILEGVIASLKRYFPAAHISVLTNYPKAARFVNGIVSEEQKMVPFKYTEIFKNLAVFYSLISAPFIRKGFYPPGAGTILKRMKLQAYVNADFIVSSGGGFINDFYAPANFGRLFGLYFAKLLGKPVVLYAQSIGPLKKRLFRQMCRYVLNKVDLIILRDNESKKIIEAAGIKKPPIYVTADSAFSMPLSRSRSMRLKEEEFIPGSKGDLHISISVRKWGHYVGGEGHQKYINVVAALADWLIKEKNANIIFASTCTGFDGYQADDRIVAREIIDLMEYSTDGNPLILNGEYTPQELSAILGKMDLHIGTRMHSNILAMLAGTPIVAIQYEFKTFDLIKDFGLEDYLVDIEDIQVDDIKRKVEDALDARGRLKEQISARLPQMEKRSDSSAKLVFEMINERAGKG
jgi:colanic acid/amylovoran biosynthesis protein